uniref:Ataxin-7-like protein 3 n=1 Tax=Oryzias sinensis TaxID=183150 RepID=A0A8C7XH34_9TELE
MKMEDCSVSSLDNSKLEGLAQDILSELVEDACLGLCFEVHRAVKQGYFFLDDTDQESMRDFEIVDQPGLDVFGQVYNQWKNKECVCPNCSRSIAASRFAPHLEKCLGMGRNSSRIANRRIQTHQEDLNPSSIKAELRVLAWICNHFKMHDGPQTPFGQPGEPTHADERRGVLSIIRSSSNHTCFLSSPLLCVANAQRDTQQRPIALQRWFLTSANHRT